MVDGDALALWSLAGALLLAGVAEWLHARRVRRIAHLAFGPAHRPAVWARSAPSLRVLAAGAVAWGAATLLFLPPARHDREGRAAARARDPRHVVVVLDVSPSMRLVDAGPKHDQSRMQRAADVMFSFFERVPFEEFRVSVVAVYNGAKPVVVDTRDFEVVRNVFGDLPMHFAFKSGKTRLFDGLEEAAKLARPWNPDSTTLVVVTDGDTVPATGMPTLPAAIHSTIVVGVGDPKVGKFIDGQNSRQDVMLLRQVAARLGGSFHDANEMHIASNLIGTSFAAEGEGPLARLGRREYALIAIVTGSALLALLPLLLHLAGTRFRPGAVPAEKSLPGGRLRQGAPIGIG